MLLNYEYNYTYIFRIFSNLSPVSHSSGHSKIASRVFLGTPGHVSVSCQQLVHMLEAMTMKKSIFRILSVVSHYPGHSKFVSRVFFGTSGPMTVSW